MVSMMRPKGGPLSPIMTGRSLSVHYDYMAVPFDDLRAAAKSAGGRFNDAFVAAVVGGLSRYHARHGSPVAHLRMFMPVNLRDDGPTDAGNAFAGAIIDVPTTIDDVSKRIEALRKLSAAAQAEPALHAFPRVAGAASRLPGQVIIPVYRQMSKAIDFVTSNVPGPPMPLFIANARIESFYAYGPIAGSALNVTALTYDGTVYLAVQTDKSAVADAPVLLECLREGLDEVLALAH
jgi:diacylglycerol O-acyltransferase / wax synthase